MFVSRNRLHFRTPALQGLALLLPLLALSSCTVVKVVGSRDEQIDVKRGFGVVIIRPPSDKGMAFESHGVGALVSNRELTLGWHHSRGIVDMGDNVMVQFPSGRGVPQQTSQP